MRPSSLPLSVTDGALMLASRARALKQAAGEGRLEPMLKGKYVGLLCDDPGQPAVLLVHGAATELGARVALVRPGFIEPQAADGVASTGRVLGRLYDAIVCVRLPPTLVLLLRESSGVPVLDEPALCGRAGPGEDAGPDAQDDRRFLWQAALLDSFA